ncbi:MAG: hypothetical protein AAF741_14530 [Bacteroidota bacterium]
MRLTEQEYYEFLDVHMSMLLFAGEEEGLLSEKMTLEEFRSSSTEEKFPARDALYDIEGMIDKFVGQNPFSFSDEKLAIAAGFKHFIRGEFYIVKFLKRHTIFLMDDVAYGVLALSDPLK